MESVLFTWVGQWVSVPAVWDGSCMLARGWNGNVIVLLKAKFQWKRLPSFLWLLPTEENWKEKLTVIQRPQLSEIIPLLVQNHYIWIKDVLGMLLILNSFSFFICMSGGKRKQDLPELSCAGAQRGCSRTALGQWISFNVQRDNWSAELRTISRTMLWSGAVSAPFSPWQGRGGGICCFHFSAAAGINGLKLPSTFWSNSHVSGFPQLNWNPWFIISFVCKMFF